MRLGTTTFTVEPFMVTVIEPDISVTTKLTLTDVLVFVWDATIVGKMLTLEWNAMPVSQYEAIRAIALAGVTIQFEPATGLDEVYYVTITGFNGEYLHGEGMTDNAALGAWRGHTVVTLVVEGLVP
jgi:hypothetical protein